MSSRHFINNYKDDNIEPTSIDKVSISNQAYAMLMNCTKNLPPIHDHHDGGLYVGFQGHAYALLHLSRSCMLTKYRSQMLNLARHLMEQHFYLYSHFKHPSNESKYSFLLGNLGCLAVSCCIYNQLNCKTEFEKNLAEFIEMGNVFVKQDVFKSGSDELFVGRAGYLAGVIMLRSYTSQGALNFPKELLYNILNVIVESGQKYSHRQKSRCPLMYAYYGTEYLGAGHGLAGIIFILLKFPEYLEDHPIVVTMIHQTLAYMIAMSNHYDDGNLPPAVDDIPSHSRPLNDDHRLVHWCHGAAGAIYTFSRAYMLWKNEDYLNYAKQCGEIIWKYGLLKKGPGICHGVAGSGYSFLVLYRITNNTMYLNRAKCFADFINTSEFRNSARTPDSPYSLFEGWAGTSCFLTDLAAPESGNFPFFDVFD